MTIAAPAEHARPLRTGSTDPAVDLVHLRRYTLGNIDLEREVLCLFSDQAASTLAELTLAQSAKAWREAAHTLKGSALAVGAREVATAAHQAETAGFDAPARDAILDRLDRAVAEARRFIAGF